MATDPKPEVKPEVKVEEKPAENLLLRAIHGRIQHPFTLTWFTQEAAVTHVKDSWIDIQVAAEKLELVKS